MSEKDRLLANGGGGGGGEDKPTVISPLQAAILEGCDADRLNEVIAADTSAVSHVDEAGDTPLFTAVNKGHVTATEILLRHGADVDVTNSEGDTVLHVAAREDRSLVLPLLLAKTKDAAKPNALGEAPVHIAVLRGHTTIIEKLCDIGADLNIPLNHATPLHLAIKEKQTKTALDLIAKGARLDVPDGDGNVPLHLASEMGFVDAELVKRLVKMDERMLVAKNNDGDIPLHIAARGGHYKSAVYLIDHGSPLMERNNSGATPLHDAAGKGYAVTASHIVKKNKLVCNVPDNNGYMPLHSAVMNGGYKAVEMLLETYTADPELWQGFLELEASVPEGLMDLALDGGHQNVARILVLSKFWERFMMTGKMLDEETRQTPMLRLIEDMPEVAKLVMDQCLETQGPKHIVARFELLDDRFTTWGLEEEVAKTEGKEKPGLQKKLITSSGGDKKDTLIKEDGECEVVFVDRPFTSDVCALKRCHPMKVLAETENSQLLDHPLVRILLRRKWSRTAPVYLSFLVYYAIYITLICAYMTHTTPPHGKDLCLGGGASGGTGNETNGSDGSDPDGTMASKLEPEYRTTTMLVIRVFIVLCVIIGLATELAQMALTKLRHYLDLHNLCDWFTYISPLLIISSFTECGAMTEWQYQLGTICVFVSCLNLIYFIRIIPFLGIYVMMVVLMLRNFMQFFTIMFLFIIAFGLCSFFLLQNQMPFSTPFFSIMKNWVMMVGEMDFTDGFHGHRESDDPDAEMYYEPLTWLMYILFLVFLSLIIMNLLTSLAVSGIESLQEDSKYCMMALQIKLALNVEFALPIPIQHRVGSVVRSQRLKTSVRRNKAVGKLRKWFQLFVYGDLREEAMIKEALQIIQEREGEVKKEVKKPLTRKEVELAVFGKTKDMRLEVKEIDKNVDNIERRMKTIEDQIADIHAMVLKLTEGK